MIETFYRDEDYLIYEKIVNGKPIIKSWEISKSII